MSKSRSSSSRTIRSTRSSRCAASRTRGSQTSITWVKDGEEALDYVFRRNAYAGRESADPRLILLDLKMPRVGGIEVTRAIKGDERTRRIPIVIMTSSKEESDVADSYNLGANSYIVKPLDFESLAEVARHAGYYWLAINRTPA